MGGCPSALRCGSCVALRATSPAVLALAVAPQNSLRSLRSLRSNSRGESVHEARCARRPRSAALLGAAEARRRAPAHGFAGHARSLGRGKARSGHRARDAPRAAGARPGEARARCPRLAFLSQEKSVLAKARAGGGRSASAAPSSAGLAGSARSAPRELTRRSCLSAESAANAASSATARKTEQRRGRGPQGHARAAAKRSTPPARAFARATAPKSIQQRGSNKKPRYPTANHKFALSSTWMATATNEGVSSCPSK